MNFFSTKSSKAVPKEIAPNAPLENQGNTIPDSSNKKKKINEVKRWCFTYNNYTDGKIDKLTDALNALNSKWLFGMEVGEKGTPHLQGYLSLPTKMRFDTLIKRIDIKEIHLEPCKGSELSNINYCIKDGKWVSNFFTAPEELEIISIMDEWMNDIEKIISKSANKRHVYWIWEPIGGVGKSSFCKYLCHKYKATYIDEGKKSDLINIIYNIKEVNSKSVICIDVPRDNKNNVSYKAIEQIKNGMICNTKYETGMKLFNSPHVIVFSNYKPEFEKLSIDRWKCFEIVNKKLVESCKDVCPLDE